LLHSHNFYLNIFTNFLNFISLFNSLAGLTIETDCAIAIAVKFILKIIELISDEFVN
jgi:hypothetical protein